MSHAIWVRWISAALFALTLFVVMPGPGPQPPGPPPDIVPDWPAPSAELQQVMGPVQTIMNQANQQQAAKAAEAFEEYYLSMMDRTISSTAAFKADFTSELNEATVELNLTGAFPGITAALDTAFETHFGAEDGPLDWNKAKAFVSAIIWACK